MGENCRVCLQHKVNRCEPMNPTPFPESPWQELGIDFFQWQSCDYLVFVYSRYIEVAVMTTNKKGSEVVRALKSVLAGYGILEKVHSDNGPPFDIGEYARFVNDWGFKNHHK